MVEFNVIITILNNDDEGGYQFSKFHKLCEVHVILLLYYNAQLPI
jgi:hypothetical protein